VFLLDRGVLDDLGVRRSSTLGARLLHLFGGIGRDSRFSKSGRRGCSLRTKTKKIVRGAAVGGPCSGRYAEGARLSYRLPRATTSRRCARSTVRVAASSSATRAQLIWGGTRAFLTLLPPHRHLPGAARPPSLIPGPTGLALIVIGILGHGGRALVGAASRQATSSGGRDGPAAAVVRTRETAQAIRPLRVPPPCASIVFRLRAGCSGRPSGAASDRKLRRRQHGLDIEVFLARPRIVVVSAAPGSWPAGLISPRSRRHITV